MKITQKQLRNLIFEEVTKSKSILLEMPYPPIGRGTGKRRKGRDEYEGDAARQKLYHMSQQAQQLHDMLHGDEDLKPWVQDKITKAADYLESAFKSITYDKGPGKDRLGE
jgi:hypothetical protein